MAPKIERMSGFSSHRLRALCGMAVVILTVGPHAPVALCAMSDFMADTEATASPCHGGGDVDAKPVARDCCDDVVDSCCLESTDSVAAAGAALDRLDHADMTPIAICDARASTSAWHQTRFTLASTQGYGGASPPCAPLRL